MSCRPWLGTPFLALALILAACGGGSTRSTNIATPGAAASSVTASATRAQATPAVQASPAVSSPAPAAATPATAGVTPTPTPPQPAEGLPPTGPPGAAPTVVVGTVADAVMRYYDVTGTSTTELRSSMNAQGPSDAGGNHNDAFTTWNIDWTWPLSPDRSCILAGATITMVITVTFPRWMPPQGTSPALVAEWNAYQQALVEHESGHVTFVVATANDVLAAIKGASCTTAEAAAQAVVARIRQHDLDYDAATNHGFTQGAHFP